MVTKNEMDVFSLQSYEGRTFMNNTKCIVHNKITEQLSKIFVENKCPYSDVYIWSNPELNEDYLFCSNPNTSNISFSVYYYDGKWYYSAKCRDYWNLAICKGLNKVYPNCFSNFRQTT